MNAIEARTFARHSEVNARILSAAAAEKGCTCQPYVDWFTYRRWKAQGFQVQKGEHGTRLTCYIQTETKDPETGEMVPTGSRPWRSALFCRCQVA